MSTLDASFEQRLVEEIRPITEHFLAMALHHLFQTGLFDGLAEAPGRSVDEVADAFAMDAHRLRGLLLYLANEGVVEMDGDGVALTAKGHAYGEARAWYTMFIGGYASTVAQMGGALVRGAPWCTRDGRYVGMGSCEISRFDGMPMTHALLDDAGIEVHEVLDLGCGNGLYLAELCRSTPGLRAWGSEPDRGGYEEAIELVRQAGMSDRVQLANLSATEFLRDPPAGCDPDLIVFGYVLHEVLGQQGEQAVVDLLRGVTGRFPSINVIVIEVAYEMANPSVMRHEMARNFWNPYFLLHHFTPQRLEKEPFWDALFERAGLRTVARVTTDSRFDSTGVELGYLLRAT